MSQAVIIGKLCAAALFLEEKDLEVMASVVREAARALGSQWQPIETAPKDEWIFLFVPGHGPARAIWRSGRGWVSHCSGKIITKGTHWMRLPAPPVDHQSSAASSETEQRDSADGPQTAAPEFIGRQ